MVGLLANVDAAPLESTQLVWGLLWGGMAAITLALLILMQTRWGQAKPVSKCVVLSIFAHLLLMSYAQMTQLFTPPPRGYAPETVRLRLNQVEMDGVEREDVREQSQTIQPWDDFQAKVPPISPETARLPRAASAELAAEPAMPLADAPSPTLHVPPVPDEAESPVPDEIATPSPTFLAQNTSPRPPAAMETPASEPTDEQSPRPSSPPLPSPDRANSQQTGPQVAEVETPSPMSIDTDRQMATNLQALQDIAAADERAEAIAAEADRLAEADNLVDAPLVDSARRRPASESGEGNDRGPAAHLVSARSTSHVEPHELPLKQRLTDLALPQPVTARRLGNGRALPLVMQARVAENQSAFIEAQGGSPEVEPAIDAALAWLASVQELEGRWDARRHGAGNEARIAGHDRQGAGVNSDMGITGLATLAFLAKGHTHLEGRYRENVQRALEYLVNHQAASGSLAGEAGTFAKMYCHAMALLAISEAYAMTGDERIRPFLDRALAYTITAQHPTMGGWRYHPGDRGDMSQFGWQVMALHSATLAGIEIPENTKRLMKRFLQDASGGPHKGLASYRPGEQMTPTMTAEGLLCRAFLQTENSPRQLTEATDFLTKHLPDQGEPDLYYWYYGTLAMYQMQGESWSRWQGPLHQQLLSKQRISGPLAGSWDPDTRWGNYGGRVYSTALATLSLEVYFRYLPIYGPVEANSPIVADRITGPGAIPSR